MYCQNRTNSGQSGHTDPWLGPFGGENYHRWKEKGIEPQKEKINWEQK